MNPSPLGRRKFIFSSMTLLALSACKKESITPSTDNTTTTPITPPPVVQGNDVDDSPKSYLESYTTTEAGPAVATLPSYFDQLTYGYSDKVSYYPGDLVTLYLTGPKISNKRITLTDAVGKTFYSFSTPVDKQTIASQKPWVNGFGFNKTVSFTLPSNLKSGIYTLLTGSNINEKITIVCKSKNTDVDITVVYPTNTDNAYNIGGGKSLYEPTGADRATVVSFKRFSQSPADYTSGFLKWANSQSYSINYIADSDMDDYDMVAKSKTLAIIGHSEYWTREARVNTDNFVASGKNLFVLSGNTMWWQVRYAQNKTQMICCKNSTLDPLGDKTCGTVNWYLPRLKYPITESIGADFIGGGFANRLPNRWNGFKIVNSASPLFQGVNINNGEILKLPSIEVDGAPVVKLILPGSSEIPVIDNSILKFDKVELLGYDFASDGASKNGLGTFMVFRKTPSSGTIVNVATMNWCSPTGMGGADAAKICRITKNMIDRSLANQSLFS